MRQLTIILHLLLALTVTARNSIDFVDGADLNVEYTYDGNGNLTSDANKGIALIEYDDMNMPMRIQFTNGNVTEYVYTVDGRKLRSIYYTAVPNITVPMHTSHVLTEAETLCKDSTEYLLGGVLTRKNDTFDKYLFDGGYFSFSNTNIPTCHYYNRDHLGNIREVIGEDGMVEQVTHYYPFGTPYSDSSVTNPALQPYKYNGKEFDAMHGLHTYDYGARQYDPLLVVWHGVDPLCEKDYRTGTNVYCRNNPVKLIDTDGKEVIAKDILARRNIIYTLSLTESSYVSFDDSGRLNVVLLNTCHSDSENFKALHALANSETNYIFSVSDKDINGKKFFEKGTDPPNPTNFSYGITNMPGMKNSPSPDDNVYIFTASFLDEKKQVSNTAHEAYGHAYFYELNKKDSSIIPNHTKGVVSTSIEYDKDLKLYVPTFIFGQANTALENQIKIVEEQAIKNYEERNH